MRLTEDLMNGLVRHLYGKESVTFGEREISFAKPFKRLTMRAAVMEATKLSEADTRAPAAISNCSGAKATPRRTWQNSQPTG